MKKDELLASRSFCMLPWVHLHFWPNGSAYPCCIWNSDLPVGEYSAQTSLEEIWNGEAMRELRRDLLAGKDAEGCRRCYTLEDQGHLTTLRRMSLEAYHQHWDLIDETTSDGTAPQLRMAYLDIRFSNLCNLRCQTCGPELSSAWYDDQVALYGPQKKPKNIQIGPGEKFWQELEPLLLTVEKAYFAGGEPLVSDEQYRVLDFWTRNNYFDVQINYTTNFTLLTHKSARILDYWKRFPKVSVSASLDDSGRRAEYLRKGTVWETVEKNREFMLRECPHIHFEITPTISAYNVFHFPKFHLDWVERGLLGPNNLRLNILTHQEFMSVRILPLALKQQVKQSWLSHLERLVKIARAQGEMTFNLEEGYHSLINFMMEKDDSHLLHQFFQRIHEVDRHRGERVFDVYPELRLLWLEWRGE
jgi:sulfatase maturation enzyme AslB (radical SAM superfamily)